MLLTINGIEVDFPYEPYSAQVRYMYRVIEALRSGNNALLESPTGTGKTLCLLCASLAWRRTYVAALQAHANARPEQSPSSSLLAKAGLQPPTGAVSSLAALVRPDFAPQLSIPRIIFSSRTHSQLAQAVAELKKTIYNPGMSLLASRDQLCIHEIATNISGSRLNAKCRRITAPSKRQCKYHLPVASNRAHENRAPELIDKLHAQPPMDIEDIRAYGASQGACPWFLSRVAAKSDSCEILFLPYNYLLDRSARSSLGIDWSNDILIIDEAHNLEGVCADSVSFDLPESMRLTCMAELSKLIEHSIRPGGISVPALEEMAKTESGLDKVIGSENCELKEIRLMSSILNDVETFINNVQFDRGEGSDISFRVFSAGELRKQFESSGALTADTYELFLELLDRAMGVQADASNPQSGPGGGPFASRTSNTSGGGSTIKILQTAIRVLFESAAGGHERSFRTVVQQSRSKQGRTVSYWCFKPAVTMQNIQRLNMRCMLLTSGTLSPMESFAAELGVQFPIRLENPHVVTKPQVWAGVLKAGPDHEGLKGGRLTSAFHARGEAAHLELGRTMIKIASLVPDGLLVFFPSYGSLYSCMDTWKRLGPGVGGAKPSVWEHLLRRKRIVAEERESSKFSAAILAHRTNVDARAGSILLAVCRGKVSEGIDFSDEYGRAVVITGLPYPAAMDPKVILKREIADEEARASRQKNGSTGHNGTNVVISGSEWYATQALRAVNQAVGRTIRHKYDYGAIILCDERYQSKNLQNQVSKWIRPSLTVCPTFQVAENSLGSFFSNAVKSSFAKDGEAKRLEARRKQKESDSQRRPEENTDAVMVAQQAISSILPPPKTEEQFLKQVLALSDELKAQNGKRKPGKKARASASQDIPKFRILDFSADNARSGLKDSGSLRHGMTSGGEKKIKEGSKRSSQFLAARAERIQNGEQNGDSSPGRREKRIRLTPCGQVNGNLPSGRESKEPFSGQIKKLFSNREDVREFLVLFREILSLQAKVKEGVGPLQTGEQLRQCRERGKEVVKKIVRLTREKTRNGAGEGFLRELRSKIPSEFRCWYDEALSRFGGGGVLHGSFTHLAT